MATREPFTSQASRRELSYCASLGAKGTPEVARRAWCSILDILPDDPEAMLNIQKLGLPTDDISLYKVMGDRPETLSGFSAAQRLDWSIQALKRKRIQKSPSEYFSPW